MEIPLSEPFLRKDNVCLSLEQSGNNARLQIVWVAEVSEEDVYCFQEVGWKPLFRPVDRGSSVAGSKIPYYRSIEVSKKTDGCKGSLVKEGS